MPLNHHYRQSGFSYFEMMLVVFILGIVAVVAMPGLSSVSNASRKIDLASRQIVEAIRFAQTESIRTGNSYGVIFDKNNETIKVFVLSSNNPQYTVYHPVNKKTYTLDLNNNSHTTGVDLQDYSIKFNKPSGWFSFFSLPSDQISFNSSGQPKYSSKYGNGDYMLESASITLSYAGQTRVIQISPMTGRVSLQ